MAGCRSWCLCGAARARGGGGGQLQTALGMRASRDPSGSNSQEDEY